MCDTLLPFFTISQGHPKGSFAILAQSNPSAFYQRNQTPLRVFFKAEALIASQRAHFMVNKALQMTHGAYVCSHLITAFVV